MSAARAFWWVLSGACVLWYSTLTIYVAVKGIWDIRKMLENLKRSGSKSDPPSLL